jgi:hypothetical protein
MLACGNYSTFSLVHEQQKPSGSDCPGLSIITATGRTLSLRKPKKCKIYKSPLRLRVKMLSNYICSRHVALTIGPSILEHTVTFVKLPLFCQKRHNRGTSTVGECRRNPMCPKIRYMRDRYNRGTYCDKALGNGRGMK